MMVRAECPRKQKYLMDLLKIEKTTAFFYIISSLRNLIVGKDTYPVYSGNFYIFKIYI